MVLTVHIDNRTVSIVGYTHGTPVVSTAMGTDLLSTPQQLAASVAGLLAFHKRDTDTIEGAVISSVVPMLTQTMVQAMGHLTKGRVLTVGAGMKTGLKLRLDNAASVGADFICNAVAALEEFSPPLIILHLAGATTIMAVDQQGNLIGRSILQGVETALIQLCNTAALLPQVSFDPHAPLIGRSTADAIRSGALYGTVSMLEGMLHRYAQALGEDAVMVGTGALASVFAPLCKVNLHVREQLLHDGLYLLYQKNELSPKI